MLSLLQKWPPEQIVCIWVEIFYEKEGDLWLVVQYLKTEKETSRRKYLKKIITEH